MKLPHMISVIALAYIAFALTFIVVGYLHT